jgi:hypothetical protein
MQVFYQTFGFLFAISFNIMLLAFFFFLFGKLTKRKNPTGLKQVNEFFKNSDLVDVHLPGSKIIRRVKIIGLTGNTSSKDVLPYELSGMLVLEKENGKRVVIKSELIKMLTESDDDSSIATSL